MKLLDTSVLHVHIADQVCCTFYLPFAWFHDLHNYPVLTHCNVQHTQ